MTRAMGRLAAIAVFYRGKGTLPAPPRSKCSAPSASKALLKNWSPQFEKSSGHKLNVTWSTAAILVKRVQAGETGRL